MQAQQPGLPRDLLEIAGASDRTLKLRDIEAQWKEISDGSKNQAVDLFGTTPMRRAMEEFESRQRCAGGEKAICRARAGLDAGAVDLFRCSSIVQEEDAILIGVLRERG